MLKTNKKTREVEVEEVTSIVCNNCTEECEVGPYEMSEFEGLGEVNLTFGYFSKWFGDGRSISFALCERCLWDVVLGFKISPFQKEPDTTELRKLFEKYGSLKIK